MFIHHFFIAQKICQANALVSFTPSLLPILTFGNAFDTILVDNGMLWWLYFV